MFVFDNVEASSPTTHEFDITGSTYAPTGDIYKNGTRARCADFEALHELATICALCNDSSVDYNDVRLHTHLFILFSGVVFSAASRLTISSSLGVIVYCKVICFGQLLTLPPSPPPHYQNLSCSHIRARHYNNCSLKRSP